MLPPGRASRTPRPTSALASGRRAEAPSIDRRTWDTPSPTTGVARQTPRTTRRLPPPVAGASTSTVTVAVAVAEVPAPPARADDTEAPEAPQQQQQRFATPRFLLRQWQPQPQQLEDPGSEVDSGRGRSSPTAALVNAIGAFPSNGDDAVNDEYAEAVCFANETVAKLRRIRSVGAPLSPVASAAAAAAACSHRSTPTPPSPKLAWLRQLPVDRSSVAVKDADPRPSAAAAAVAPSRPVGPQQQQQPVRPIAATGTAAPTGVVVPPQGRDASRRATAPHASASTTRSAAVGRARTVVLSSGGPALSTQATHAPTPPPSADRVPKAQKKRNKKAAKEGGNASRAPREFVDSSEDSGDDAGDNGRWEPPPLPEPRRSPVTSPTATAGAARGMGTRTTATCGTAATSAATPRPTSPAAAPAPATPTPRPAPGHAATPTAASETVELGLACQALTGYGAFQLDAVVAPASPEPSEASAVHGSGDASNGGSVVRAWRCSDDLARRVFAYVQGMAYALPPAVAAVRAGRGSSASGPSPQLLFPVEEALAWLAEQEYVVGTVLLTCCFLNQANAGVPPNNGNLSETAATPPTAQRDSSGASIRVSESRPRVPAVPAHVHPTKYAARYVMTSFSQWGSVAHFSEVWEAQFRLITSPACSLRQRTVTTTCPITGQCLTFSSEMECGNMRSVTSVVVGGTTIHQVWVHADPRSDTRAWFRFNVSGFRGGEPLCVRLMNLTAHERLYRFGMRPVWRVGNGEGSSATPWLPIDEVSFDVLSGGDGQLSFFVVPHHSINSSDVLHFSYCIPYGYNDLLCYISRWHSLVRSNSAHSNIRFEERVLCRTLDSRKLHMLIITNLARDDAAVVGAGPSLCPSAPYSDFSGGKKAILLSGRVHPGEVTASHALHGAVTFLLSSDPLAEKLRQHFVFFIVPMVNPDGVARGHWRHDQRGANLNRYYKDPDKSVMPTVAALKAVFRHLATQFGERFFSYVDFHSHASREKAFLFGNHLGSRVQCWNLLLAKLMSLHVPSLFSFRGCKFAMSDMVAKEGTSRVLFGEVVLHSYTMEVTPFTNGELDDADSPRCVLKESAEIGRGLVMSFLDYCGLTSSLPLRAYGYERALQEMRLLARTSTVGARVLKLPTRER